MTGSVLIAGASGVVGRAAIEHFCARGWNVTALSRRHPDNLTGKFRHFNVDLTDAAACEAIGSELSSVTHVVFAALYEKPGLVEGWRDDDQMQTNLSMLRNLMEVLVAHADDLKQVSLLQGTKAYGAHIHRIAIPAREDAPRDRHDNFYWLQEDYLRSCADEYGFGVTIWRPQLVLGDAIGVAMNIVPVIGVCAALARASGSDFGFPGGPDYVTEAVDARLLAGAFHWAAETPAAAGEIFNITNGDVLVWRNVWRGIGTMLNLPMKEERRIALADTLPGQAANWDALRKDAGLPPLPLERILGQSHHYADFVFATGATTQPSPVLVSTIKLRKAGFSPCMDTQERLGYWLKRLIQQKILPDFS